MPRLIQSLFSNAFVIKSDISQGILDILLEKILLAMALQLQKPLQKIILFELFLTFGTLMWSSNSFYLSFSSPFYVKEFAQ